MRLLFLPVLAVLVMFAFMPVAPAFAASGADVASNDISRQMAEPEDLVREMVGILVVFNTGFEPVQARIGITGLVLSDFWRPPR